MFHGINGNVTGVDVARPASEVVQPLSAARPSADLDLKRMAEWALNYLINTPRPELGYEPVFQCHPLRCPPVPAGHDVVVPCDTDARMNWEWYYMRDITGSQAGRAVEAAFHTRLLSYLEADGLAWAIPGSFNEGDIEHVYTDEDKIIHIWGTTKILHALAEDYARSRNPESRRLAGVIMRALRRLTTWDEQGRCWLAEGMGAIRRDGTVVPNSWNPHPAPLVEPLVTYWRATGDPEGLEFARAYAEGIINNLQPGGVRFGPDGSFRLPDGKSVAHSHATLHAIWGIADLGIVLGETRYLDFARRAWDWMLSRGTGTGWFPAMPDNCNETCCVSDMMSIAALLGQGGRPEYYDCVERYLRNTISNLQFIITPEFEAYYRRLNANAGEGALARGLDSLRRFQGGIIGGSGLNDYENELLGGVSGFEMFGCCAPEGMRAIYTAWSHTIMRRPETPQAPAGVYVNLSFSRASEWGQIVSFMPAEGRLTVKAAVADMFYLRPPAWAPLHQVRAFVNGASKDVTWQGSYVRLAGRPGDELTITYPLLRFTQHVSGLWADSRPDLTMTFHWLGNMVVSADPAAARTPLFLGIPRSPYSTHISRIYLY
jgi:hypothetical protein